MKVLRNYQMPYLNSIFIIFIVLTLPGFQSCRRLEVAESAGQVKHDLLEIQRVGKLTALCRYDPTSYFIYKGQPMGYEYELLKIFAHHLGVELEIKVPKKWNDLYEDLHNGTGDIIAANLTVTMERSRKLSFSRHHSTTRQVLVQRLPDDWRKMKKHEIERKMIRDPIDLAGKDVYVRRSSSYYQRLVNLSEEIGSKINIFTVAENMENDFLIKMVAKGVIDYTVADGNVMNGYSAYYSNIDAKTPISFSQKVAWAVRENSPQLLEKLDSWIVKMKTQKDPRYYVVYDKYFKSSRAFKNRLNSGFLSTSGGNISPYDSLFKKYSEQLGWDWKLLASVAFQESQFDPEAVSWAGATGVMQLLPSTSKELGIEDPLDPVQNIEGGVKLLKKLFKAWNHISDEHERVKFTLASYNSGLGHVYDARRLAEKYGKDPEKWSGNVDEFILKKSEEKYFYDDVVKYGYCRGNEPYQYVKEVLNRYAIYKNFEEYLNEVRTSYLIHDVSGLN